MLNPLRTCNHDPILFTGEYFCYELAATRFKLTTAWLKVNLLTTVQTWLS